MKYEANTALYCPPSPTREGIAAGREILVASREAADAYQKYLAAGADRGDAKLARDPNYARLLRAGQMIRRAGGEASVQEAIRLITQVVPGGSAAHFDRLWCGLFPQAEG